MLMVYGWVTLFNAGCRVNVQSIRALVRELYGANHIDTQIISAMYAALFLPGVIVATIWYNKWSIRTGLIIGAALQAFGAGAKWLIGYGFYWVYIGQAFWALANPFINLLPACLATTWFEDSKRILAITVAASFNTLGVADGYGLSHWSVDDHESASDSELKHEIIRILVIYLIVGAIILLVVIFTFQGEPKVPPSSTSTVFRDDDIIGTYRELWMNRNFILLTMSHVLYYTTISSMIINFPSIATIFDLDRVQKDLILIWFVSWGFIGSITLGLFIYKTNKYRTSNILIGILGGLTILTFIGTLQMGFSWVLVSAALSGFCIFPALTNWFIYSSEIVYPLRETTSSGVFLVWAEIFGTFFAYLFWFFIQGVDSRIVSIVWFACMAGFLFIGSIIAWTMKPINHDRADEVKNVVSGSFVQAKAANGAYNINHTNDEVSTVISN